MAENGWHEELAIIEGIHVGMRDCGSPVLWFGVTMLGCGSL